MFRAELAHIIVLALAATACPVDAFGQSGDNTVAILSGGPNSDDTSLQTAYDLAATLDDGANLRVLPVVGGGGLQNVRDACSLRGVDVGLTQTGILSSVRRSDEPSGGDDRIVYIAKLFNEEAHLVARSDIKSLAQLQGKKVNLDLPGSGTEYAMRNMLDRLDIRVEAVNMPQTTAFQQLRAGAIAATVLIAGKPAGSIAALDAADGLHLLPIPYTTQLGEDILPATLTHDDYPALIAPGEGVDTIAVGTVLFTCGSPRNSDRYRRVGKFVEMLFARIAELQRPPRHPKWREVNLAARLPGLDRFEPAQAWLDRARDRPVTAERPPITAFMAFCETLRRDTYGRLAAECLRFRNFGECSSLCVGVARTTATPETGMP